jgi:hypothetical protein
MRGEPHESQPVHVDMCVMWGALPGAALADRARAASSRALLLGVAALPPPCSSRT